MVLERPKSPKFGNAAIGNVVRCASNPDTGKFDALCLDRFEREARATVVETYAALGEGVYWTNAVTELAAGQSYAREMGVEHNVVNPNPHEFVFVEIELK